MYQEVEELRELTIEQKQKVEDFEQNQTCLDDQLRAQDCYTSKDCVVAMNPPLDARSDHVFTSETLGFSHNIWD